MKEVAKIMIKKANISNNTISYRLTIDIYVKI